MTDYDRVPESVSKTRARVRQVLAGHSPRLDDAELIVSEWCGNLARHGSGTWWQLVIGWCDGFVHLEVAGSPFGNAVPVSDGKGTIDPLMEKGRGLWMVANLADGWGHGDVNGVGVSWADLGVRREVLWFRVEVRDLRRCLVAAG